MVRTQLYLNRGEYDFVRAEATRRGETMAAVIRGFTFRNGVGVNGGGVLLSSSFPTVVGNVFTQDSARFGGGSWSGGLPKPGMTLRK